MHKTRAFPSAASETLNELGVHRVMIAKEFGGLQLDRKHWMRCMETLGAVDLSAFYAVSAQDDLAAHLLSLYGTPEQKLRYLPRLATGQLRAACCLQEPHW